MTANGCEVSSWSDENVLKLYCGDVNTLKTIELKALNGWTFIDIWLISK